MTIYSIDKFTRVEMEHLAERWDQLTPEEQEKIKTALNSSIEQAIDEVMLQAGFNN